MEWSRNATGFGAGFGKGREGKGREEMVGWLGGWSVAQALNGW